MMDLDEQAYAMIRANVAEGKRLQSQMPPDPPKEKIMSLATALEQRRKIDELIARMRDRMSGYTREASDGQA